VTEHDPICAYEVTDVRFAPHRNRWLRVKVPTYTMATGIAPYARSAVASFSRTGDPSRRRLRAQEGVPDRQNVDPQVASASRCASGFQPRKTVKSSLTKLPSPSTGELLRFHSGTSSGMRPASRLYYHPSPLLAPLGPPEEVHHGQEGDHARNHPGEPLASREPLGGVRRSVFLG
jgi:hypothetical protein